MESSPLDDDSTWTGSLGEGDAAKGLSQCPYLLVLQGPARGRRIPLHKNVTSLGRGKDADVALEDPRASAIHCVLHVKDGDIVVEDLNSRNGVFVDGEKTERAVLGPYSQVRVGATLFRVEHRTESELELERALIQSERLAAVGTLASGIAHQFNNINAAILGYAELLLKCDPLPDDAREMIRGIEESAQRAKSLTDNLLTFSGVQMGTPRPRRLDLVVRDTLALVEQEFLSEGIRVERRLDETLETTMDTAQIGQVVLHLLVNARHALLDRPERRIIVATGADERGVWLRVEDTGCGIPPEDLDRVFMPFYSTKGEHAAGRTPQSRVKGTGLGLSVSHTIAEHHGGSLKASAREGGGACFTLRLPVRGSAPRREPRRRAPTEEISRTLQGRTVVVLDDEQHMRRLLELLLRRYRCEVLATDDGTEALEWIRSGKATLVLADLQMPKMPGQEFLKKLFALPADNRPAAIVMTGRLDDIDLPDEVFRQVSAVLTKPFDMEAFQTEVAKALEGREQSK